MASGAGGLRIDAQYFLCVSGLMATLILGACGGDGVVAPTRATPAPSAMLAVGDGDYTCFYDEYEDDYVCYRSSSTFSDEWGVPFYGWELSLDDPAVYDYGSNYWQDQLSAYYYSYGTNWDGLPPEQFNDPWMGYRDTSWYTDWGNLSTNDWYSQLDSLPRERTLAPWEQVLFAAEATRLQQTSDPGNFCSWIGNSLQDLLTIGGVMAFDNDVTGLYRGHTGELRGLTLGSSGNQYIDIKSQPNNQAAMLQTFRHEGTHVTGTTTDNPDVVGQSQDPGGPNYIDPMGPRFKATIMNANPWQLNAENAGYYCGFWSDRLGA